jgi:hypothetical protein
LPAFRFLLFAHDLLPKTGRPLFGIMRCRKRVDKRRFVDETASTARSRWLRGLIVVLAKLGREKTRRENEPPHPEVLGAFAPSLEGWVRQCSGPSSFEGRCRGDLRMTSGEAIAV